MEPDIDEFLAIFPEFSSIGEIRLEYYFDLTIPQVGESAFGTCYAQAIYLLLAHNLTMIDPSRATEGAKASEKVGDLAVSYDTSSGKSADSELNQTQYGKQFIQLRNSKVTAVLVLE